MPTALFHHAGSVASSIARSIPGRSGKSCCGPIGLEFGLQEMHLVQLERHSAGLAVKNYATAPYPESGQALLESPKKLKKFFDDVFSEHGVKGREIVTCMLPQHLKLTTLHYTCNGEQTDGDAILGQMKGRVEGELEDYVLDYVPIRQASRNGGERSALVASVRRETVIDYLELLRKARLRVQALEIGPVAIKRLIGNMLVDRRDENVLVVNLGRTHSYLTVLSGRRLIFDHEVEFGEDLLVAHLCDNLDIDTDAGRRLLVMHGCADSAGSSLPVENAYDPEMAATIESILRPFFYKLVDDVNKALLYVATETHGEGIRHMYLIGGVARWRGAEEQFNTLFDLPVTVLNPFARFAVDQSVPAMPGLAVATGLALRSMEAEE